MREAALKKNKSRESFCAFLIPAMNSVKISRISVTAVMITTEKAGDNRRTIKTFVLLW